MPGPVSIFELLLLVARRNMTWPHDDGLVVAVGHQPLMGRTAAALMTGTESGWRVGKGCAWWFRSHDTGGRVQAVLVAVIAPDLT